MDEQNKKKDKKKALIILVGVLVLLIIGGGLAVFANPSTLPSPTNLEAVQKDNHVILTWDDVGVYAYNVYRSTVQGQLGIRINDYPVKENRYVDTPAPGLTYYYTVRSTDEDGHEDPNLNQVSIYVEPVPPNELSIKINDDAVYTNDPDVILSLSAVNADECRYSNDEQSWTEWEPYTTLRDWRLDETKEGEVYVYYQCRREVEATHSYVDSEVVNDSIIADYTPPAVALSNVYLNNNTGNASMHVSATDNIDDNGLDCFVSVMGTVIWEFSSLQPDQEFPIPSGTYLMAIGCEDDAGNVGYAVYPVDDFVNPYDLGTTSSNAGSSGSVVLIINDGDDSTCSRHVVLSTIVNGEADKCRFANEEDYPSWSTGWLDYDDNVEWTLSEGYGDKKVYVECKDADGNSLGIAWDSILYKNCNNAGACDDEVCGNGFCNVNCGENYNTCPNDCSGYCGDGVCEAGEDEQSCPQDCSTTSSVEGSRSIVPLPLYTTGAFEGRDASTVYFGNGPFKPPIYVVPDTSITQMPFVKVRVVGQGEKAKVWQTLPNVNKVPGFCLNEQCAVSVSVPSTYTLELVPETGVGFGERDVHIAFYTSEDKKTNEEEHKIIYDGEPPKINLAVNRMLNHIQYMALISDEFGDPKGKEDYQWVVVSVCDGSCYPITVVKSVRGKHKRIYGDLRCKEEGEGYSLRVEAVDYAGNYMSSEKELPCIPDLEQEDISLVSDTPSCCNHNGYTNDRTISFLVSSPHQLDECRLGYEAEDGIVWSPYEPYGDGTFTYTLPDLPGTINVYVECKGKDVLYSTHTPVVYDNVKPQPIGISVDSLSNALNVHWEFLDSSPMCYKIERQVIVPTYKEGCDSCYASPPGILKACPPEWSPEECLESCRGCYTITPFEVLVDGVTDSNYVDNDVKEGHYYRYRITGRDAACNVATILSGFVEGTNGGESIGSTSLSLSDSASCGVTYCTNTNTLFGCVSSEVATSCRLGYVRGDITTWITNYLPFNKPTTSYKLTLPLGDRATLVIISSQCKNEDVQPSQILETKRASILYDPNAPIGQASASVEGSGIKIAWNFEDESKSYGKSLTYSVYRKDITTDSDYQLIANNVNSPYMDLSAQSGHTYKYKVESKDCAGNTGFAETLPVVAPGGGNYTLTVHVKWGRVFSNDGKINCNNNQGNCSVRYGEGAHVSLMALDCVMYQGHPRVFARWEGDCSGSTCSLVMDSDKDVTAIYQYCSGDCDNPNCGSVCGNGVCEAGEDEQSCPQDCNSGFCTDTDKPVINKVAYVSGSFNLNQMTAQIDVNFKDNTCGMHKQGWVGVVDAVAGNAEIRKDCDNKQQGYKICQKRFVTKVSSRCEGNKRIYYVKIKPEAQDNVGNKVVESLRTIDVATEEYGCGGGGNCIPCSDCWTCSDCQNGCCVGHCVHEA